MNRSPTMDDLFRVMAAASVGDASARVELPDAPSGDDMPTRFAVALNLLLDELAARADHQRRTLAARRKVDEALEASRIRNAAIVDTALDAIIGMDADGFVNEWNAAAERMFGWTRAEVVGQRLAELIIPPHSREAHHAGMRRYVETGVGRVFGKRLELTAMRRDGEEFPVELSLAAVHGPQLTFIGSIRDIAERRRAEDALRASEERYRVMFEQSPVPMIVYGTQDRVIVAVNGAAVRHYGYAHDAFVRLRIDDVALPASDADADADAEPGDGPRRSRHRKCDGSIVDVDVRVHDIFIGGRPLCLLMADDVTERLRLEEQLQQAQKMDAVGRLAGGVAHDFNNVLSVILGYAGTMMATLPPSDPRREDLAEICAAGQRAAELTHQLLTFSRQQAVQSTPLDLNEVLGGMNRMLERAVGVDIRLVSRLAPSIGTVRADRNSVEQVIMNLVVNARDAMPAGGEITIETADVFLDGRYAQSHLGVAAGPHVMLSVSDTGVGMDKATQARAFEPFFTTKPRGKGTGLGLSMVFGIVRRSGGSVWLDSEPGKGTVFKVYLPRADAPAVARRSAPSTRVPGGSETVLLVEDDHQVRRVTCAILKRAGYDVLEASSGAEAVSLSERQRGTIHLLLSDVVMPQLSGPELASRLAPSRPAMKVLFVSGYTDDIVLDAARGETKVAFLQKPLTPEALQRKVREVLDGET